MSIRSVIYIASFCVLPEFRKQGIGKQLMNKCINETKTIKYIWVNYIVLNARKQNTLAHKFYHNNEFNVSNITIADAYTKPKDDELLFYKKITKCENIFNIFNL